MKKLHIILSILILSFLNYTGPIHAQSTEDGIILSKKVTKDPNKPYGYNLTLETYIIGDETHTTPAIDVVLVLDMSQSMAEPSAPVKADYEYYGTGQYKLSDLYPGVSDFVAWSSGRMKIEKISLRIGSTTEVQDGYATDYACYDASGNLCYIMVMWNSNTNKRYFFYYDITTNTATLLGKTNSGSTPNLQFDSAVAIYKTSSSPKQKRDLLKTAAKSFADIISRGAKDNNLNHRLSAVRYGDNSYYTSPPDISENDSYQPGASVVKQFTDMNETGSTNLTNVKTALGNMATGGQTYPQNGVKLAEALYNKQGSANQKVVVFMTDGEPGSGSFNNDTANDAVAEILNLKKAGAKVFSVGIFNSFSNKDATYNFMNAFSSNYSTASSYNVGDENAHDYFRVVGEKSLEEIFKDIAEEVISGGPAIDLTAAKTEVRDYLTPGFKLPAGTTASSVIVNAYHCVGYNPTTSSYNFDTNPVDPTTLKNSSSTSVVVDSSTGSVTVKGFDYAANYVRTITKTGQSDTYDGYKLVFTFPIEIDVATNPGGANMNTNTSNSGVYFDENGQGTKTLKDPFISPIVKIPNVIVGVSGLRSGESAIFSVSRLIKENGEEKKVGTPINLIVTGDSSEGISYSKLKIQDPGRYIVEITSWSWAYTPTTISNYEKKDDNVTATAWNQAGFGPLSEGYAFEIPYAQGTSTTTTSIKRNVVDFTEDIAGSDSGTIFLFETTEKTGTPNRVENIKNNNFN